MNIFVEKEVNMSEIQKEVLKVLDVMEESIKLNFIEDQEEQIEDINKIKEYINNNLDKENDKVE